MKTYKLRFYDSEEPIELPELFNEKLEKSEFLSEGQKIQIKHIMTIHAKKVRKHFKEDGWKLDSFSILEYVIEDILGFTSDQILGNICRRAGVVRHIGDESVLINMTEKVFYGEDGIYTGLEKRDLNDVILGEL